MGRRLKRRPEESRKSERCRLWQPVTTSRVGCRPARQPHSLGVTLCYAPCLVIVTSEARPSLCVKFVRPSCVSFVRPDRWNKSRWLTFLPARVRMPEHCC